MKILAIIISIYILVLNTIPCMDKLDNCSMHKTEISHSTDNNQKENGTDHCSPFCTCNCCTSPIMHQVNTIHFDRFILTNNIKSNYIQVNIPETFSSIWQPPKLS